MSKLLLFTILLAGPMLRPPGSLEEAVLLFNQKNYPPAKKMLLHLSKKYVREARIPFYLGMIASIADQDYNRAIQYFQEAVELEPSKTQYRLQLIFAWKKN